MLFYAFFENSLSFVHDPDIIIDALGVQRKEGVLLAEIGTYVAEKVPEVQITFFTNSPYMLDRAARGKDGSDPTLPPIQYPDTDDVGRLVYRQRGEKAVAKFVLSGGIIEWVPDLNFLIQILHTPDAHFILNEEVRRIDQLYDNVSGEEAVISHFIYVHHSGLDSDGVHHYSMINSSPYHSTIHDIDEDQLVDLITGDGINFLSIKQNPDVTIDMMSST